MVFKILRGLLEVLRHFSQFAGNGRESFAPKENQDGRKNDEYFPCADIPEKSKDRIIQIHHEPDRIMFMANKKAPAFDRGFEQREGV